MFRKRSIKLKADRLWIIATVTIISVSVFGIYLLSRTSGLSTANAPYQLKAMPTEAPIQTLPPGIILIPAQIIGPGELLIPSRGVVYVATDTPGTVYAQSYENVEVHRTKGYAHPVVKEEVIYINRDIRGIKRSNGLTRSEKGAIIGGLIGAGTGPVIGKQGGKTGTGQL